MNLHEQAQAIRTRDDFVGFVHALLEHLQQHRTDWEKPVDWNGGWNTTTADYLSAIARWVKDMDGFYLGAGKPIPEQPSWEDLGHILAAALTYE